MATRLQSTYGIRPTLYGNSVAIGTFLTIFKDDIAPSGCFECNGQAISRTDYSELYTKFGTHFGEGDGSTTFNLPNFISTADTKLVVKAKNIDIGSAVNADTLGGKLASDYALKADYYTATQCDAKYASGNFGLGTPAVQFSGDFNSQTTTGFFRATGVNQAHAPNATDNFLLMVMEYSSVFVYQFANVLGSPIVYQRSCNGGTWSTWKQIANTDSPVFSGDTTIQNTTTNKYGILALKGTSRGGEIDFYDGSTLGATISGGTSADKSLYFTTNGGSQIVATMLSNGNSGFGGIANPKASLHSAGTTILGCQYDAGIWEKMTSPSQINIVANANTINFYWRDENGGQHTVYITAPTVGNGRTI